MKGSSLMLMKEDVVAVDILLIMLMVMMVVMSLMSIV